MEVVRIVNMFQEAAHSRDTEDIFVHELCNAMYCLSGHTITRAREDSAYTILCSLAKRRNEKLVLLGEDWDYTFTEHWDNIMERLRASKQTSPRSA